MTYDMTSFTSQSVALNPNSNLGRTNNWLQQNHVDHSSNYMSTPNESRINSNMAPDLLHLANIEASMIREILIARLRAAVVPQVNSFSSIESLPIVSPPPLEAPSPPPQSIPLPSPPIRVVSETSGLDLLSTASIISASTNTSVDSDNSDVTLDNAVIDKKKGYVYIDDTVRLNDILCGRGGRTNNHPGNKRYRQVINDMRIMYQKTEAKTVKTDLSRAIVEHCCSYGARFLKLDNATGKYFVQTKAEARKKTSQALREIKDLK